MDAKNARLHQAAASDQQCSDAEDTRDAMQQNKTLARLVLEQVHDWRDLTRSANVCRAWQPLVANEVEPRANFRHSFEPWIEQHNCYEGRATTPSPCAEHGARIDSNARVVKPVALPPPLAMHRDALSGGLGQCSQQSLHFALSAQRPSHAFSLPYAVQLRSVLFQSARDDGSLCDDGKAACSIRVVERPTVVRDGRIATKSLLQRADAAQPWKNGAVELRPCDGVQNVEYALDVPLAARQTILLRAECASPTHQCHCFLEIELL